MKTTEEINRLSASDNALHRVKARLLAMIRSHEMLPALSEAHRQYNHTRIQALRDAIEQIDVEIEYEHLLDRRITRTVERAEIAFDEIRGATQ